MEWVQVGGRATIDSYVINQRPGPGFTDGAHVIAIVRLAEGPRQYRQCRTSPENLAPGMPLRGEVEACGALTVPVFRPA